MKNQKPKRIPWYQVWRIWFTVNVIVHCLFCFLFGSMFDRLKFWRIKQLLNVWKCTYFSTGDSGRNIQLSQFANFTNRKIVSCFGLPFSVSKIIFFCEFGLAWNRIRINTWTPSLLRLRANLSCCFFFFFIHGSCGVHHRVLGGVSSGIHQLHNRDDEDDNSNTWNGNSTQHT